MTFRKVARRGGQVFLGLFLGVLAFGWATNRTVINNSQGKIYTDLSSVPVEPVGLVLGTSPSFGGHPNPFFVRRMEAAADLYHAGKVRKLLVSGDHGTKYYDEPTAMRKALVARGVPLRDIVTDDAGFRTLDSVVRARVVFDVKHCTIITDDFHLPRALYIASERDLDAVGFQTTPLDRRVSRWTYIREMGARSLVWIDLHVINRQPKFLGPPDPIL